MRNYKYISTTSKVCVALIIVSLAFLPFATFHRAEFGQEFSIDLHNAKFVRSSSGWISGNSAISDNMPYLQIINTYSEKQFGDIPGCYLIPIYLHSKIPMFLDMWFLLIIGLVASLFMSRRKYVGFAGSAVVIYYIYLAYLMFNAVGFLNGCTTISSIITGVPVTLQENGLLLKISSMYLFKLAYGWYIVVIAGVVLFNETVKRFF